MLLSWHTSLFLFKKSYLGVFTQSQLGPLPRFLRSAVGNKRPIVFQKILTTTMGKIFKTRSQWFQDSNYQLVDDLWPPESQPKKIDIPQISLHLQTLFSRRNDPESVFNLSVCVLVFTKLELLFTRFTEEGVVASFSHMQHFLDRMANEDHSYWTLKISPLCWRLIFSWRSDCKNAFLINWSVSVSRIVRSIQFTT